MHFFDPVTEYSINLQCFLMGFIDSSADHVAENQNNLSTVTFGKGPQLTEPCYPLLGSQSTCWELPTCNTAGLPDKVYKIDYVIEICVLMFTAIKQTEMM